MANGFGSTTQNVMKCPACQAEVQATLSIDTQIDTTRPKEAVATVSIAGMRLSHDCVPCNGHKMPSVGDLMTEAVLALGDLTAMIPGVPPMGGVADAVLKPVYEDVWLTFNQRAKDARLAALEREARAAQGNRAATYERLQGTPRNGHWHPSLADPRTLADRRLADAQNALAQALKSDN